MKKLAIGLILLTQLSAGVDLQKAWHAWWIAVPGAPPQDYGVYHFRRTFELPAKPARFVVHVSGDNRFQLFANGTRVAVGPARGDLTHWRYQTVDLAPHLTAGKNVLAAVVWNDGEHRAIAQISNRTGFLLQVDDPQYAALDTNAAWKCLTDKAYTPQPLPDNQRTGYYALAANEKLDAAAYPWGWEALHYNDSGWQAAEQLSYGAPRDLQDAPNRWMLVPSEIPLEEQRPEPPLTFREPSQATFPLTVPPAATTTFLLDQKYLTTAYPELTVTGGKGAEIDLQYAETLFEAKNRKGNRNDVAGRLFFGPSDTYLPDGGAEQRVYRPLFWRTYRYLKLTVKTAAQPLRIQALKGTFTAYPFERKATFTVSDTSANPELQQILNVGWRTARLCAHETYMDCPFYEQLQYAGDARIQMMVSLYMTGDARLMKNGIALINSSRTAEGATFSRAPSALQQYIPPFSLWWIGMVHDYWLYVNDPAFVKQMMPGVHAVLDFYARYQKQNGSLRKMPWWSFVDWVKQWPGGVPPSDADGGSSAALDLQLLMAYQWAADLEHGLGSPALAGEYAARAVGLKANVLATDWDESRGLVADQPSHRTYSQQVNTLAVLSHALSADRARAVVAKLGEPDLAQSSIYFRAYTNAALREVGLGARYVDMLGPWKDMLHDGLTTWSEWNGADTRSDCHAWGASPNFELLRTVAGIESMAPGFQRIRIAPNPGTFKEVSAQMPHTNGAITVKLSQNNGLDADVVLPTATNGEFEWAGVAHPLRAGPNHLHLPHAAH